MVSESIPEYFIFFGVFVYLKHFWFPLVHFGYMQLICYNANSSNVFINSSCIFTSLGADMMRLDILVLFIVLGKVVTISIESHITVRVLLMFFIKLRKFPFILSLLGVFGHNCLLNCDPTSINIVICFFFFGLLINLADLTDCFS